MVPFAIVNLMCLTAGVCMKMRFKSKVTRGFSFLWLKKNVWHQGNNETKTHFFLQCPNYASLTPDLLTDEHCSYSFCSMVYIF